MLAYIDWHKLDSKARIFKVNVIISSLRYPPSAHWLVVRRP